MDFDWKRFGALQVCCFLSFLMFFGLVFIGLGGVAQGFHYWVTLAASGLLVFFGIFFVAYPRLDGSWRSIGEKPSRNS